MAPLQIDVYGSSSVSRVAERAHLIVEVSSKGLSQEKVSEEVMTTSNTLRQRFQELSPKNTDGLTTNEASITQFSMTSFSTNSHLPKDKEGKELKREYNASTTFHIIFRNFEKLGEVATGLSRTPRVAIRSTQWRLTDATVESLGSESRQAAMRDAIHKAKDYADVLGRDVVAIEVSDTGARSHGRTMQGAGRSRGTMVNTQGVDGLSIEPEDVELSTSINVKFQAD